jgi:Flp pilus assembly protein TadD
MLPLTAATVLGMGAILWVSSPLSYDSGIRNAVSYSVDNTQTSQVTAVTQAVLAAVDGAQDPYWRTQAIGKLYAISAVDEGIKLAEESAQMFPNDMQIWNLVAIAYEQTGRAKLAVPARQRTVELDPLNTDNMELLAQDKAAK